MPLKVQRPRAGGRGQASPASQRPPQTATPQRYPPEQVEAGRTRFVAQCGFCHGRDAAGGEGGTDLTRSALVAGDVRGDKIRPVLRTGRVEKGMPAFTLPDADLAAIVAFIHDQKAQAESATGGRRAVDAADLSDRQRRCREAVLRRRLREMPSGRRRPGWNRQSIAGTAAPAAHALPGSRRPGRRTAALTADRHRDDAVGRNGHRQAGVPRRVHDRDHRRVWMVPRLADASGDDSP